MIDYTQYDGHSAGPWCDEDRGDPYTRAIVTTDGDVIGAVRYAKDKRTAANCRIVAHAPDILNELKGARVALRAIRAVAAETAGKRVAMRIVRLVDAALEEST